MSAVLISPYATSTQARFWTYDVASLSRLSIERQVASRALLESSGVVVTTAVIVDGKRREPDGEGGGEVGDKGRSVKRARSDISGSFTEVEGSAAIAVSESGSCVVAGVHAIAATMASYLTLPEEETVLDWAALALFRICRCAPFDRAITSTALIFFRRFFARARLAEYLPHEVM